MRWIPFIKLNEKFKLLRAQSFKFEIWIIAKRDKIDFN